VQKNLLNGFDALNLVEGIFELRRKVKRKLKKNK